MFPLRSNQIKTLCDEVIYLKSLTALDLRNNELEEVPAQLGMLPSLKKVSLRFLRMWWWWYS